MKKSVYLETSVVSYLAARPSRDLLVAARQQTSLADEVLRELWRVKDANAKRFNYDLNALFDDLRRR